MSARSVLASVVLALLSAFTGATQDAATRRWPSTAAEFAALRAAWREAIELDLPAEILADAIHIESGSHPDDELAGLCARALHAAGLDERAERLATSYQAGPHSKFAAARIALDRDDPARAIQLLAARAGSTDAVRYPAEPECWLLLGRARARAGELARAEPLLVEFVKRAPWHVEAPQAWFLLVDAARSRGDGAEALRREEARTKSAEWHAFYRARRLQVRASPTEPLPRYGLAQLWLAAGELSSAQREVERALVLDPRFCRGLELDAEIARRQGDAARARTRATAALECDPKLVEVHLTLARLARDAGDADGSARDLARYRELGGTRDP